jgi:hypothetical protein
MGTSPVMTIVVEARLLLHDGLILAFKKPRIPARLFREKISIPFRL